MDDWTTFNTIFPSTWSKISKGCRARWGFTTELCRTLNRFLRRNFPVASNPEDGFGIRQPLGEQALFNSLLQISWLRPWVKEQGAGVARLLLDGSSLQACYWLSWLGRKEGERAPGKLSPGSGNKGSLCSGQERVSCHPLRALRLALQAPQPLGGEYRGASVRRTNLRPSVDSRV